MVASLLKVIASGIQDERLAFKTTLYPFRKIWIKAGRFTTRWERLDFENTPAFGNTGFFRILRKGHLVTRLYLIAQMPDIFTIQAQATNASIANGGTQAYPRIGWTNSLGHALIQQLTLDIAASRVETINSRLLEILDEFHTPLEKVPVINELIKRKDRGFTETSHGWPQGNALTESLSAISSAITNSTALPPSYQETVAVPLPFWFTRGDTGCALPIDAMSMDEVRVGISFRGINGLYYTPTQVSNTSNLDGSSLWPLSGTSFYKQDPTQTPNQTPLSNQNGPIKMPLTLPLGDCYIMAEYVYLDQNEANRFRLADLQVPVVQHYAMNPYDTQGLQSASIRLDIPNPTRDLYFMCNPFMASSHNAHFLATRDMTGTVNTLPTNTQYPWWPDAVGLYANRPSTYMRPAFQLSDSEPISGYELTYQGSLVRFRTEGPALFRSIIPSYEQRKSPWVNRYYYNLPLAIQNGFTPFSRPNGEANLDKITNRDLVLRFRTPYGNTSGLNVGRFMVYVYAETYNMLRVYGGRAGMMFAY
jgi:Major capsid protein N-terminus